MYRKALGDVKIVSEQEIALEISGLKKEFLNEKGSVDKCIISDMNLKIKRKEFLCILGPSGCGKTTLLRCIAGFEKYSGQIYVNGEQKNQPGTDRIMVFQDFNQLFPWKTVEKNIQYPLRRKGIRDKKELDEITEKYLDKVNLHGIQKKYPYQLSGGMKQRVAIAKALALKPQIILMDEPFAALDAMTRNKLQDELTQISREEECTIVFITHNIQEAIVLGSRILVMSEKGKIIYDEENKKPVTPASEGYGAMWKCLHDALYCEG